VNNTPIARPERTFGRMNGQAAHSHHIASLYAANLDIARIDVALNVAGSYSAQTK
jgi:hypothetical protein